MGWQTLAVHTCNIKVKLKGSNPGGCTGIYFPVSILIFFSLHIYFLQAVKYFCFNFPPISRDSYKTESAPQLTARKIRWEDSTSLLLPTFFLLSGCWENLPKIMSEFKSSSRSSKFSWAIYPQYPLALHESLCYWAANLEDWSCFDDTVLSQKWGIKHTHV